MKILGPIFVMSALWLVYLTWRAHFFGALPRTYPRWVGAEVILGMVGVGFCFVYPNILPGAALGAAVLFFIGLLSFFDVSYGLNHMLNRENAIVCWLIALIGLAVAFFLR